VAAALKNAKGGRCLPVKNPEAPAIGEILAASEEGTPIIRPILSECLEYLASGVANVINLINPETVVFYGQLFDNQRIRDELVENINKHTFHLMRTETAFIFSDYHDELCAVSGAAYAIQRFLL
jgi:predicted NBD/HSP70 family sugar kinase